MIRLLTALLVAVPFFISTGVARGANDSGARQLGTRHFAFEYHERHEKVARRLAGVAERVRTRQCRLIKPCYDGEIKVKIASSEGEFLELQPYGAHIDWAAGVAYAQLKLIILRVDNRMLLTIDETFEHETSHILLLSAVKKRPPRWFIEGLAIHQAGQNLVQRFEEVAAASISDAPFRLDQLEEHFPGGGKARGLAYAQSGLFVAFLVDRLGPAKMQELVRALSYGMSVKDGLRKVAGLSLSGLEEEWADSLGNLAWLRAATSSWTLWLFMTLLFLLAVVVKYRRTARRRKQMEVEETDWVYIQRPDKDRPTFH